MKHLTIKQASQRLGCHRETVGKLIKQGKLQAFDISTNLQPRYRIPESAIQQFESGTGTANSGAGIPAPKTDQPDRIANIEGQAIAGPSTDQPDDELNLMIDQAGELSDQADNMLVRLATEPITPTLQSEARDLSVQLQRAATKLERLVQG